MEEKRYDFCPKCGALSLNGVCQSCGHREAFRKPQHSEEHTVSHAHSADETQPKLTYARTDAGIYHAGLVQEPKSAGKKKGSILAVVFCCGIFCFIVGMALRLYLASDTQKPFARQPAQDDGQQTADSFDGEKEQPDVAQEDGIYDTSHRNHFGEVFEGEYYEQFCDYIDESVNYQVRREGYAYKDVGQKIYVSIDYVQITSDAFDTGHINELLSQDADYYRDIFEDEGNEARKSEYANYTIVQDTYVTFNDADKISLIINRDTGYDDRLNFNTLYSRNVDLSTGSEIEAWDMLDYSEEFVEDWMEISEKQNGTVGPDDFTKADIWEQLNSEDCIAFYTPLGMEVGYSYYYETSGSIGWITATIRDYERYKKML
ncbi:MAG: hypothetical protein IJ711_07870 [Lachnospiraceae bacterium]|nr:hypothetical protein [Lachnospiraceae bacterium]